MPELWTDQRSPFIGRD